MRFKHFHIINTSWFRIYFRGSYSIFEIDFGKMDACRKELVIHLFTKNGLIEWRINNYPYTAICQ
jgi:hypothetical protein